MADMYSDGEDAGMKPESESESNDSKDYGTTVVPKDFFKRDDLKPGQMETVEIKQVYDDSVEISCKGQEEPKEETGEEDQDEMPPSDAEMASMMQ